MEQEDHQGRAGGAEDHHGGEGGAEDHQGRAGRAEGHHGGEGGAATTRAKTLTDECHLHDLHEHCQMDSKPDSISPTIITQSVSSPKNENCHVVPNL